MTAERTIFVSAGFDDLRCPEMRLLHEASRLGRLHVLLWSDAMIQRATGRPPKFPFAERSYFVSAIRYVSDLTELDGEPDSLPLGTALPGSVWAVSEGENHAARQAFCEANGIEYRVLRPADLQGFPMLPDEATADSGRKKVIVTGCYDWFHSGHVRFFEEASEVGDLYVVVGHDANIRLLKGEGHPMFNENERRYMVQGIRFVRQALVSSGDGWLDAEPEIQRIRPDIYVVNEDGDRPEKQTYCEAKGIEYRVLKRTPKAGLPRRQSTDLRGF